MRALLALVGITLLLGAKTPEGNFSGKVVEIVDGDTLTVLTSVKEQVRVRLAEIDAPERRQPYGSRSRQTLAELAFQKAVKVVYIDTDNYGRVVGRIYAGDVDISAEMVRRGAAWVYRDYVRDRSLFAVEADARDAKRGLWGLPEAGVPPWEWRHASRTRRIEPQALGEPFTCGTKNVCRQMISCEEARFYLTQCSVESLDGDKDGIPCETLCR
jgi:endonuclease YncB( thermonuclease family)